MKKCPFCAEEVQDEAIKCRHCGEIIPLKEKTATQGNGVETRSKEKENLPGLYWACLVVGEIAFIALAYILYTRNLTTLALATLGASVLFFFSAPIGWKLGDSFRKFAQPSMYFANGAIDLAKKRLFWMVGPQATGVLIVFLILAITSTFLLDSDVLEKINLNGKKNTVIAQDKGSIVKAVQQIPIQPTEEVAQTKDPEIIEPKIDADNNAISRYGILRINDEHQLLFNEKQLSPALEGDSGFSIDGIFKLDEEDVVLLQMPHGSSCPAQFIFVSIKKSGVFITNEFGTCSDLHKAEVIGNSIHVEIQGFASNESTEEQRIAANVNHTYVYENNDVKEIEKSMEN